jgi:cytochrome P450
MIEMIESRRRSDKAEERFDLFSSLLDAADSDSGDEPKLTDRELMGNRKDILLNFTDY